MIKFCLFLLMDVNKIAGNYVVRQVFVLVGVIFLVFGEIFLMFLGARRDFDRF